MFLKKLDLFNFRSYRSIVFEPKEKTLILGENGRGKTNLLEAIYLMINGDSFRVNNKDSIIYEKEKESIICSLWESKNHYFTKKQDSKNIISLHIKREGKKNIYFNRKQSFFSSLIQQFPLVLFSPESLSLLKNSADGRRKWLDSWLVTQGQELSVRKFKKVLRQKQILLSNIKRGKINEESIKKSLLDSTNEYFIKESINLVNERKKSLKNLLYFVKQGAKKLFGKLLKYDKSLDLGYVIKGAEELKEEEIEPKVFCSILKKNYKREIESGVCLYGAHRDDFQVLFRGKDARYYCSQGQLRGLLLALMMGQIDWFREMRNQSPLLLLDDVFSEIDSILCYNLLGYLKETSSQVILTSTQVPKGLSKQKEIDVVHIKQATIRKESVYENRSCPSSVCV